MLDANVLYSAGLRDFLLRLADQYLYTPLWSADIHAEWIRSVLADRPDLMAGALERTRAVMDQHFPNAVVRGYSARIAGRDLPDSGDLHVLAAAIEGGPDLIVTHNRATFRPAAWLSMVSPHSIPTRSSSICSKRIRKRCSRLFATTPRR